MCARARVYVCEKKERERAVRILVTYMKESFTASQAAIASSSPGPRYHLVRESSYRRPVLVANINRLLVRQGRSYLYDPGTCKQQVEFVSSRSSATSHEPEQSYKFRKILAIIKAHRSSFILIASFHICNL